jgi:hypothetical protein
LQPTIYTAYAIQSRWFPPSQGSDIGFCWVVKVATDGINGSALIGMHRFLISIGTAFKESAPTQRLIVLGLTKRMETDAPAEGSDAGIV